MRPRRWPQLFTKVTFTIAVCTASVYALSDYLRAHGDYYFPDRYETAWGYLGWAIILSVVALVSVIALHFSSGEKDD